MTFPAPSPSTDPLSPVDFGWTRWDWERGPEPPTLDFAVGGRIDWCSEDRCSGVPVAALLRARSHHVTAGWQPYCERHARLRGVVVRRDALIWSDDVLAGRRVVH